MNGSELSFRAWHLAPAGSAKVRSAIGLMLLAILSAVAVSCTTEKQVPAETEQRSTDREAVDLLRSTSSFDYMPELDPAALLVKVDVAVLGTVTRVESALIQDDVEQTGAILVTVSVDDRLSATPELSSSSIQLLLRRPTNLGTDAYDAAFRPGRRLALFGYPSTLDVVGRSTDSPPTVEPDPQGLILEGDDGSLINVWGEAESQSPAWAAVSTLDGFLNLPAVGGIR